MSYMKSECVKYPESPAFYAEHRRVDTTSRKLSCLSSAKNKLFFFSFYLWNGVGEAGTRIPVQASEQKSAKLPVIKIYDMLGLK